MCPPHAATSSHPAKPVSAVRIANRFVRTSNLFRCMKTYSNSQTRNRFTSLLSIAAIGLSLLGLSPDAEAATLEPSLNEQIIMVPVQSGYENVQLETTVFMPSGPGPFPLVVMNHGKALGNPQSQSRDRFVVMSREFVKRGYAVVIPMRKGFSRSGGTYYERGCDMINHGQSQADDLQGTLEYLQSQNWVDKNRIIVAGQSYGGLATMALGTRNVQGVRGLINFAGGLKIHGGGCRWDASLVNAFAEFGGKTTLPSIWFYGENDQHFGPDLAVQMRDAYVAAGGRARLVAYGPFKSDAHGMVGSRDGVPVWWPETERFLKELGMPTDEVIALPTDMQMAATNYAAVENVDAVPFLRDSGRQQYREFLNKPLPRAFAISSSGAWSWAEDGDDPRSQVLAECQKTSPVPCKLYAVDNAVVWSMDK